MPSVRHMVTRPMNQFILQDPTLATNYIEFPRTPRRYDSTIPYMVHQPAKFMSLLESPFHGGQFLEMMSPFLASNNNPNKRTVMGESDILDCKCIHSLSVALSKFNSLACFKMEDTRYSMH